MGRAIFKVLRQRTGFRAMACVTAVLISSHPIEPAVTPEIARHPRLNLRYIPGVTSRRQHPVGPNTVGPRGGTPSRQPQAKSRPFRHRLANRRSSRLQGPHRQPTLPVRKQGSAGSPGRHRAPEVARLQALERWPRHPCARHGGRAQKPTHVRRRVVIDAIAPRQGLTLA